MKSFIIYKLIINILLQGISCSGSGSVTPSLFSRSISPAAEICKTAEKGQGDNSSAKKPDEDEELLDFIET